MMKKEEILEKYANQRQQCLKWSRVMGYYRPTESYNLGKKSEARERVYFRTLPCVCGR